MTWTERRFARHGPVALAHDRLGEGSDGEPLLLVMGLAVSRHWWPQGLCDAFAGAGFAVARYDQRDAGESTRLPKSAPGTNPFTALAARRSAAYTAEDMADDAVAVM
nr:alpha/beta hydrolase [Streptomyces sp. DSM 41633]